MTAFRGIIILGIGCLIFICKFMPAQNLGQGNIVERSSNSGFGNPHKSNPDCIICHKIRNEKEKFTECKFLCSMCHDLDKYNKKSYTHPLGIGCDACHSYHEPDKSGAFLKRDPIESCLKCHSQLKAARTHPMRVKDPNTGGELTCTSSCHRIHGADYRNLCSMEPGRQLCISCHDNLR